MCAVCHIGNGVKAGEDYTFQKESSIDCLVCHDRTNTYYRTPPTHGNAACATMFEGLPAIDYAKVAQHVGLPGRENCGSCHYNGGGGDGVKHGDLDFLAEQAVQGARRAHGGGRAQLRLHQLPRHQRPSDFGQPLRHDGQGRKGRRQARRAPNRGELQVLPRRQAASQTQPDRLPARRPRRAHRLPDLPHPEDRARRRRHHHRLGLEQRRPAPQRQGLLRGGIQAGQRRAPPHLLVDQGRLQMGREVFARLQVVQRRDGLHARRRQGRSHKAVHVDQRAAGRLEGPQGAHLAVQGDAHQHAL